MLENYSETIGKLSLLIHLENKNFQNIRAFDNLIMFYLS